MAGRPKVIRTPEEIKVLQKLRRQKYQTYFKLYQKNYYLRKLLANPNYQKKNNLKKKSKIKSI